MQDGPSETNLEQAFENLQKSVRSTAGQLRQARAIPQIDGTLRAIERLALNQLRISQPEAPACKMGCDACCHRSIEATALEAVLAAIYIDSQLRPDAKHRLKKRLAEMMRHIAQKPEQPIQDRRLPCPMLEDGRCTIHPVRPQACAIQSSPDVAPCQTAQVNSTIPFPATDNEHQALTAIQRGLQDGLQDAGLWGVPVDFARAVHLALGNLPTIGQYLSGYPIFELAALPQPLDDSPRPEPMEDRNHALYTLGDSSRAFHTRSTDSAEEAVFRLNVPMTYGSEDDVQTQRARMLRAFDDLRNGVWSQADLFSALANYSPLNLSYQQENDLSFLSELGDWVTRDLASRLYPDLTEPIPKRQQSGKIRVGYIGTGLDRSSGGYWCSGWLKRHGKEFETYAYYLNPNPVPGWEEFRGLANKHFHLPGSVAEAARLIKSHQIDVLIYPDASCEGRNYQFASLRLAPIQCAGWGGPETSGLPNIDYFLSGDDMEPMGAENHYREQLVRLPGTGISYPKPIRAGSGLKKVDFALDDGPLYLCLQTPSKLHPKYDPILKEISDQSGRPIVFFSYPKTASHVVESRLKASGIKPRFMPFMNLMQFYDLVQLADVTLDTPGWSGGITTLLALQQKRPVITLPGQFRRGCHAQAFLRGANAPGLIAESVEDYIDLALSSERRAAAMGNFDSNALFDNPTPAKSLNDFLMAVCS